MKNVLKPLPFFFMWLVVILVGCKKEAVLDKPGGGHHPEPLSHTLRFSLEALPGESNIVDGLSALVTILNEQNEPVLVNKKLSLTYNAAYVSDSLTLSSGNYKITGFLVIDENKLTRFATPVSNSAKASLVQKPLALSFSLPKNNATLVQLEVAKVVSGDQPENFGYPAGSFTGVANDPDTDVHLKIKIHPIIKIGAVVYDSIPVSLTLTTWNAAGQPTTTYQALAAGISEVMLPKSGEKYSLRVSRWGATDELVLSKKDIQEGTVYTLGGSREAKKLKSELVYKFVDGAYKPESKNAFEYDASGKLTQVLYYQKKADNTTYLALTDKFSYNSIGKAERIKRFNETNTLISESSFTYDQQGKVVHMKQKEEGDETSADVTYYSGTGHTGISGNYGISIRYQYTKHYYTMNYNMSFQGGMMVEDAAITSHHSSELGRYQYDFQINPYVHMNWPDIFLSRSSKHNKLAQQKQYSNAYPTVEPFAFSYTYDNEGYPRELITSYRSYLTDQYLYKTKTIFNY